MPFFAGLVLCGAAGAWRNRPARTPDIHFTPTRHNIADAMLRLANVTADDVVYDLGSGDGRMPIIAAQKYGATRRRHRDRSAARRDLLAHRQ